MKIKLLMDRPRPYVVTDREFAGLKSIFPGVDVLGALLKLSKFMNENSGERLKTAGKMREFIDGWLRRAPATR